MIRRVLGIIVGIALYAGAVGGTVWGLVEGSYVWIVYPLVAASVLVVLCLMPPQSVGRWVLIVMETAGLGLAVAAWVLSGPPRFIPIPFSPAPGAPWPPPVDYTQLWGAAALMMLIVLIAGARPLFTASHLVGYSLRSTDPRVRALAVKGVRRPSRLAALAGNPAMQGDVRLAAARRLSDPAARQAAYVDLVTSHPELAATLGGLLTPENLEKVRVNTDLPADTKCAILGHNLGDACTCRRCRTTIHDWVLNPDFGAADDRYATCLRCGAEHHKGTTSSQCSDCGGTGRKGYNLGFSGESYEGPCGCDDGTLRTPYDTITHPAVPLHATTRPTEGNGTLPPVIPAKAGTPGAQSMDPTTRPFAGTQSPPPGGPRTPRVYDLTSVDDVVDFVAANVRTGQFPSDYWSDDPAERYATLRAYMNPIENPVGLLDTAGKDTVRSRVWRLIDSFTVCWYKPDSPNLPPRWVTVRGDPADPVT